MSEKNLSEIINYLAAIKSDTSQIKSDLKVVDKRLALIEQRLSNIEEWVPADNKGLKFDKELA